MTDSYRYALIGRGVVPCWHADGECRWGDGPWNPVSASGAVSLEHYIAEGGRSGTLVYDAFEADHDAFASFVIAGPIVGATLAPGSAQPFGDHAAAAVMAPHLGGEFRTIALQALRNDRRFGFGSLDRVAPDVYCRLLAEHVPGVKLGAVRGRRGAYRVEWSTP